MEEGMNIVNAYVIPWGIKIAIALAIFIVGKWLAKTVTNALKAA